MFNSNISFSSFIKVYDNTLTEEFCKSVCQKLDRDPRKKLGVFGRDRETDVNFKSSLDLYISSLPEWKDEDNIFYTTISQFLKKYKEDIQTFTGGDFSYGDRDDHYSDTGYQVKVYQPNGHYDWHSDYQVDAYAGVRTLTYIWYLNDDFDEGETEFCTGEKITPKTGRLLMFPASWMYVHKGCIVRNKNKYIATGWYHHQHPETKRMVDTLINKDKKL